MSIILWWFHNYPALPQLLPSPLVLPQHDPFKAYLVGLLICAPCTGVMKVMFSFPKLAVAKNIYIERKSTS